MFCGIVYAVGVGSVGPVFTGPFTEPIFQPNMQFNLILIVIFKKQAFYIPDSQMHITQTAIMLFHCSLDYNMF